MLILTPILMPVVKAAGIDPVYFGVLFVVNNAIGLISPPVGTVLNVVAGVSRVGMTEVIQRRVAVHVRAAGGAGRDDALSLAGHRAGRLFRALNARLASPPRRHR